MSLFSQLLYIKQYFHLVTHSLLGCVLVYRYSKEGNINELRHNSMYGYENKRNSLVYRYTRTAPFVVLKVDQNSVKSM